MIDSSTRPAARIAAVLMTGLALALSACTVLHTEAPVAKALPGYDPTTINDTRRANEALAAVAHERELRVPQWQRREYDCYDRFFVNDCVSAVQQERRQTEQRFRHIEVRARQVLRDDQALQTSERLAQDAAQRQQSDSASQRGQSAADTDARQAEHQKRVDDRNRDDAGRAAATRENRQRQADKARAAADRAKSLEARKAEAAEQRRRYDEKIRQHEEELQERAKSRAARTTAPAVPVSPGKTAPGTSAAGTTAPGTPAAGTTPPGTTPSGTAVPGTAAPPTVSSPPAAR